MYKLFTTMKNIVKIDLRKFNQDKLKEVSDMYNLNYESLVENKNSGFAILWVDVDSSLIVAYTIKKDKSIRYTTSFGDILSSMKEVELVKQPKDLSLDGILEKISKYGIASLRSDEKDFLDNLSK